MRATDFYVIFLGNTKATFIFVNNIKFSISFSTPLTRGWGGTAQTIITNYVLRIESTEIIAM